MCIALFLFHRNDILMNHKQGKNANEFHGIKIVYTLCALSLITL